MNRNQQPGTHDPEWMRTHEFTIEDVQRPGGRGLAYAAQVHYGNTSGRRASAEVSRLERIARQQHQDAADAALAAQQQAGGS